MAATAGVILDPSAYGFENARVICPLHAQKSSGSTLYRSDMVVRMRKVLAISRSSPSWYAVFFSVEIGILYAQKLLLTSVFFRYNCN